jgi:thiol-disulfide isomerase/thioredoxin
MRYAGPDSFYPDGRVKEVNAFLNILQRELSRRDSILQSFCMETKVDPGFKAWQQRNNRYDIANSIIYFTAANRNYRGDVFDTFLFPIDDDWAISADLYGLHLRHYALHVGLWRDTIARNHFETGNKLLAYRSCLDNLVSNEKAGLSRDLMCYKVYLALLGESYTDYAILLTDGMSYLENKLLMEVLKEKKTAFEAQEKTAVCYLDPDTKKEKEIDGDIWAHIEETYKGKVVYVDIYADWCGPCRSEIPHAIELHDYFKGKDIAFINLCLASEKTSWLRLIESSHMKGDHYYFNQAQTQKFRARFEFEGYPTYLIMDKSGRMIDNNAPRPSSKDLLRSKLTDLMEKSTP